MGSREHQRLIVKFKEEAEYYASQKHTTPLTKNGRRVKTIVTNDDFIVVANKFIKAKIYVDGRYEISPHDNKTTLECK